MLFFKSFCSFLVCSSSLQGKGTAWYLASPTVLVPCLPIYLREAHLGALECPPGKGALVCEDFSLLTEGPKLCKRPSTQRLRVNDCHTAISWGRLSGRW